MQNQILSNCVKIHLKKNLTNENAVRSEIGELVEVEGFTFIRKGQRRKEFDTFVLQLTSSTETQKLMNQSPLIIAGIPAKIAQISQEEAENIEKEAKTKLYVGNLPKSANNLDLWNHFKQFGKLAYSYVISNPKTQKSKGFGFVIFDKRSSLEKALAKKSQKIKGKTITMKIFLNKSQIKRSKGKNQRKETAENTKEEEEVEESEGGEHNQSNFYLTKSNPEIRQEKVKIPNMEFDGDSLLKATKIVKDLFHSKNFERNLRYNNGRATRAEKRFEGIFLGRDYCYWR